MGKSILFSILGILCISIALFYDHFYPRRTAAEINQQNSSGFHGRHIPDPLSPPPDENIKILETPDTIFYAQIIEGKTDFKINFWYQCNPECQQIWLSVNPKRDLLLPLI